MTHLHEDINFVKIWGYSVHVYQTGDVFMTGEMPEQSNLPERSFCQRDFVEDSSD